MSERLLLEPLVYNKHRVGSIDISYMLVCWAVYSPSAGKLHFQHSPGQVSVPFRVWDLQCCFYLLWSELSSLGRSKVVALVFGVHTVYIVLFYLYF